MTMFRFVQNKLGSKNKDPEEVECFKARVIRRLTLDEKKTRKLKWRNRHEKEDSMYKLNTITNILHANCECVEKPRHNDVNIKNKRHKAGCDKVRSQNQEDDKSNVSAVRSHEKPLFSRRVVMFFSFLLIMLSVAGGVASHDCLTGAFEDIQGWVWNNGSLRTNQETRTVFLDLSGYTRERIEQTLMMVMQNSINEAGNHRAANKQNSTEHASKNPEDICFGDSLLYLSLARSGLQRIPLFYKDQNGSNDGAKWKNLRFLSLFGSRFLGGILEEPIGNSQSNGELINESYGSIPEIALWSEDLRSLELPGLLELDMRNCSLQKLGDNVFTSMPNLRRLYLGFNSIYVISAYAFSGLTRLIHLDVSLNNVPVIYTKSGLLEGMTITKGAFQPLQNIKSLDFSYTRIVQTCVTVFSQLGPSVERLSLCYTKFPAIRSGMFENTSIKYLDISGNIALEDLSTEAFKGIDKTLEILYAKRLGIKSTKCIENLKKLKVLALNSNDIPTVESSLMNLQNLQILDLTDNRITNWNELVFYHMKNLELLCLPKNNLNLLTFQMLHDLNQVKYLSMGGNSFVCNCVLRDFIDGALENENMHGHDPGRLPLWLQNKTNIPIDYNENLTITELTKQSENIEYQTAYELYSSLITHRNEWNSRYPQWDDRHARLERRKLTYVQKEYLNEDVMSFTNMSIALNFSFLILDYTEKDYLCTDSKSNTIWAFDDINKCDETDMHRYRDRIDRSTVIVIVLVIFGAVLTVLLILIWKSWYVRYFFQMMKNAAVLSVIGKEHQADDQKKSYQYDVFVSYCEVNRPWVLDNLLPEIESNASISVCLHERDFQVGLSILENIISSMDRSRVLLLVVSNHFLQSQWCQFEMHLAQHRLLETRREQLILVLLEDIPRKKRPNTLHYLMMTKTYIVWPKLVEERPAFWKRLRRSLEYKKANQSNC